MRPFTEAEVYEGLVKNGVSHDVANWLACLDSRVFFLEKQLAEMRRAAKAAAAEEGK